jgi:methanogenic corrinoid protein MtbC1
VRATDAGRNIGQVAVLDTGELEALVREDAAIAPPPPVAPSRAPGRTGEDVVQEALAAVDEMDANRLEKVLTRAALVLEPGALVDRVVVPVLGQIGTRWRHGRLGPANEHLASGIIRKFLEWLIGVIEVPGDAPVLICTTPKGQRHELGALLGGVVGAGVGWTSVFLGPDLPAEEIAKAAHRVGARAVAISALHPLEDPDLPREVATLATLLPPGAPLLAGGPAVLRIREDVEAAGGHVLMTMADLRTTLAELMANAQVVRTNGF